MRKKWEGRFRPSSIEIDANGETIEEIFVPLCPQGESQWREENINNNSLKD